MIELKCVTKSYNEDILKNISVEFGKSGFYLIKGDSGSGKTTLLNIIGGLDEQYDGGVYYNGIEIKQVNNYNKKIGFIFQQFKLLDFLIGKDNVDFGGFFEKFKKFFGMEKIISFSLNNKLTKYSGGQRQKIAIARALAKDLEVLLCDEPTGSLDCESSNEVMTILKELSSTKLVIVVSHDSNYDELFDCIIRIESGAIKILEKKKTTCDSNDFIHSEITESRSLFRYCLRQFVSKWKRNVKVISGVYLGIFSILLTFIVSSSVISLLKDEINLLFPPTAIAIRDNSDLIDEDIYDFLYNELGFIYGEPNGYSLVGLSIDEDVDNILFIADATKQCDDRNLLSGKVPVSSDEIVLSKTTALNLFGSVDCLSKKLYLWYSNDESHLSYCLNVVGVTEVSSFVDSIYLFDNTNIDHIKKIFEIESLEFEIILADLMSQDIDEIKSLILDAYSNLEFKIMSDDLHDSIVQVESVIKNVIIAFSFVAILSALFLVIHVLFLSVVERTKEIGLIRLFGGTDFCIYFLMFFESVVLLHIAFLCSLFSIFSLVSVVNGFLVSIGYGAFLFVDANIVIFVYVVVAILSFLCSVFPSRVAINLKILDSI